MSLQCTVTGETIRLGIHQQCVIGRVLHVVVEKLQC